jgi:lysozyme
MIRWARALLRQPFAYPSWFVDSRWIGGRLTLARVELDVRATDDRCRTVAFYEGLEEPPEFVEGVDVSHYQGRIDWGNVARAGKLFCYVKATEGASLVDGQFTRNWDDARQARLLRGAYHTFRGREGAVEQAQFFLSWLDDPGELPVALDIESGNGLSYEDLASGIALWVDYVAKCLGRPLVFASPGFWACLPQLGTESMSDLWLTEWDTRAPSDVGGWSRWCFWQYGNSVSVPGIRAPVNLNRFNGGLDQLHLFLCRIAAPPAPGADEWDLTSTRGLQRALNELGWNPRLDEDGIAGERTLAALRAFQVAEGLPPSGLPDDRTANALAKSLTRAR